MKIAQVMLSKGFGGAERYCVDLSLALADAGHEVLVICHRAFSGREQFAAHAGVRVHTVSVLGAWDPFAVSRMSRALRDFGPDVVQAHLARGAHMTGKALRRLCVPLVVKTHNYVDLKYYAAVDHFITTTQDQRAYLIAHGVAAARISVIANFSRIPPAPQARALSGDPPVFITLGRMVHKKGFDVLLTAFARYREQGGHGRLVIGGDGPEFAALTRQCAALGLSAQVDFPGWVDDVRAFLASGDVFVLPSRDEPFGIAVLEAMAAGLPLIATRTQGPLEILDAATACLVPIGDAAALADAMRDVVRERDATLARASLALAVYRDKYHESAVVPRLLSLYRDLQGRGRVSALS